MHVVWVHTEGVQSSHPNSRSCGAWHTNRLSCSSAVGLFLKRLSVAPTGSTSGAAERSFTSPPQSNPEPVNDPTSPNSHESDRSPRRSNTGSSAGVHRSPKPGSRGGAAGVAERGGVWKDIELDGLCAYTKESTADWCKSAVDGALPHKRSSLEPVPPDPAEEHPSSPGPSTDVSAPSLTTAASSSSASQSNSGGHASSAAFGTVPVYLLRPVHARGSLVIPEGGPGQNVPSTATDQARPTTSSTVHNVGMGRGKFSRQFRDGIDGNSTHPPPLTAITLEVGEVAVQVNVQQYAVLNGAISTLAMSQRRFRFRRERPQKAVMEDPEAWWRYAIK